MPDHLWPTINASLNASTIFFLLRGYWFIRKSDPVRHGASMLSAFATAMMFLVSYLVYHAKVGTTPYTKEGWIRTVYFSILGSHTVLAALIPPLAVSLLILAFRKKFDTHKKIARWVLPAWLYVSITGIVIYFMLY